MRAETSGVHLSARMTLAQPRTLVGRGEVLSSSPSESVAAFGPIWIVGQAAVPIYLAVVSASITAKPMRAAPPITCWLEGSRPIILFTNVSQLFEIRS